MGYKILFNLLPEVSQKVIHNNIEFKDLNLGDLIIKLMPTRFDSEHFKEKQIKAKKVSLSNLLKFGIKLIIIFSKEIIRLIKTEKKKILPHSKKIFFYLPNKKWQEYLTAITFDLKEDYFVLSNSQVVNVDNSFSIDNDRLDGQIIFNVKLLFSFYVYSIGLLLKNDKDELSKLLALFRLYLKMFNEVYIVYQLTSKIKFKNYVSLLTNGDTHRLIEIMLGYSFKETYGVLIGPYTRTKEINYIISKNIFYQTENERKLIEEYGIHLRSTLIKGGVIINPKENHFRTNNIIKRVLFIDTCENENPNSDIKWEKNLQFIYSELKQKFHYVELNHKFHPGLNKSLKEKGLKFLSKNNINVLSEIPNYYSYDLVVSYKSTVLQHFIITKTPIVILDGEFNLFSNPPKEDPFTYSPLIKAFNYSLLKEYLTGINEEKIDLKAEEVYSWFIETYNYPNGIFSVLERITT